MCKEASKEGHWSGNGMELGGTGSRKSSGREVLSSPWCTGEASAESRGRREMVGIKGVT